MVVDGDELTEKPVKLLNEVETFLQIPHFFTIDHFDFSGTFNVHCTLPYVGQKKTI